jgi:hypothetical protein
VVDSIKFWTVFAVITLVVLFLGWRQPIRYRFMSAKEIAALEAPPAQPTPIPSWMWDRSRATKLDREGYNERGNSSELLRRYSSGR